MTSSADSSPVIAPRRLSIRRGSVSASDPYGNHSELNFNPSRSTASKLTIVRVNDSHLTHDSESPQPSQQSFPSPGFQSRRHKRHGSGSSVGSTGSESGRLSFAFSTFGPANPNGRPSSPSASRQQRPSSPSHVRRSSVSKPKLAPEQVIELARSSTHPKPASPIAGPSIPASLSSPNFTPLPDNVYLPFVDRPSEVSILITSAPTTKLLTLLSQTFPHHSRQSCTTVTSPDFIDTDPRSWNFTQLEYWLKSIDRDLASDEDWTRKARTCILSHSELIWERIKGALGVPPELDMPEDEDEQSHNLDGAHSDEEITSSSPAKFTIAVDEGAPATPDSLHMFSSPFECDTPPDSPPISIEPVFATETSERASHDAISGLGDITEDTEDESDNTDVTVLPSPSSPTPDEMIHGLRICTSTSSPHLLAYSGPLAFPATSPLNSPPAPPSIKEGSGNGDYFRLRRSNSSSSSLHIESPASMSSSYSSYHDVRDDPYHVGAERGPGHPLFPGSFANLAMGPTLKANNPALRRPQQPPPPAFSNPHTIRTGAGRKRGWTENHWDGKLSEYAVTTASESSVIGEA